MGACAAHPPGRVHRAVPPTKTDKLPSGSQWLHEIKHDGFRIKENSMVGLQGV
jgi:ATP-dependent DNA ligase